jgi:predicted aspartyl protease
MSREVRFVAWPATLVALLLSCQPGSVPNGSSGNPALPASGTDADRYIQDFDYPELARAMSGMPQSPERDYFAGVLANREGRVAQSIALLAKVVPQLEPSNPKRAAIALHTLADDYMKSYRYTDAIQAYEDLLHKFPSQMDDTERKSAEDEYDVVLLLKDAPPQTISYDGRVDVLTRRNPALGAIEAKLKVNGVEQSWILDTGANLSTVSASFARKLGVRLSTDAAQTQGVTGAENKLRTAILPELVIGGATLKNVVLLVLDDKSLNVPTGKTSHYQIQAVLGYPVMQALRRVTFTSNGHFLAGPDFPSGENGAKLYMNELTPLLLCRVENREVLFSIDTGANGSVFSNRYHEDFPAEFKNLKKKLFMMGGAGGLKKVQAYYLPLAELGVGATQAVLHNVPVVPVMDTDLDRLYGNLGRDLVDPYSSFTIDFANMRVLIGEERTTRSPSR